MSYRPGGRTLLVGATLVSLLTGMCRGHGDLHAKITLVTRRIVSEPRNARLYLHRAELHRLHKDWTLVERDLRRAASLDPTLDGVVLVRAHLHRDLRDAPRALALVDRFLKDHPHHGPAWHLKAKVLLDLGREPDAVAALDGAIRANTRPGPELFVLRAQIQRRLGRDALPAALAGLEEGLRRIGPATTVHLEALEVELELGRLKSALARLDDLAARSPRRDVWLERRADVCQRAGLADPARDACRNGIRFIDGMAPRLRVRKDTVARRTRLAALCRRLEEEAR